MLMNGTELRACNLVRLAGRDTGVSFRSYVGASFPLLRDPFGFMIFSRKFLPAKIAIRQR